MRIQSSWALLSLALVACGGSTPPVDVPTGSSSASPTGGGASGSKSSQVAEPPCTELDFEACKAACERGTARACTFAARAVDEDRRGVAAQKSQIVDLLQKACDGGDPEGCRELGHAYREGDRVAKDPAKADGFYKKALATFKRDCDAGRATGCDLLGHMTSQGWGVAQDEEGGKRLRKQAVEIWEHACGPTDPASCAVAGDAYRVGVWATEDPAHGSELLHRGCDAGDPKSCFLLGLDLQFGTKGAAKDPAAAAKLHRKACDAGLLTACATLSELVGAGEGVPKDVPAAIALAERACRGPGEMLVAPACHDAAELRRASGEKPSSPAVLELERRSCLLGFQNGCDAAKGP
jgi:TPR repeat protein